MIAAVNNSGLLDPRELTDTERKALVIIHDHSCFASRGGYYGRAPHRVTRQLARQLIGKGVARTDHNRHGDQLMLTGKGLATYAVMEQRRQRRQG
ncbi:MULTISPECIES: hypothetical protein [unclassified Mesorhizobium]|uniref:hypothetical protein n=1 Tax=unclassified Mesorhizobium TaxID=325217 RepID=UPI0011290F33|nr:MULTISPECIES: hypothetical protein [unclassified Mesorhizobium]TPM06790.1 hypothetical protein FJ939_12050 [Mesorhizobium sp. B2-3-8]TPM15327.1 hypothetical protein FJ940_14055 [Mesorhizobium sp. B2-3-7]